MLRIGYGEIRVLVAETVPGYDEARTIWNAMIDRRPGLIVRCAGASDMMQAVQFSTTHELLVAVRGGGHNINSRGSSRARPSREVANCCIA